MGAAGIALIVLSMMPRVGKRRGAAPAATRDERRFDRDRETVPANGTTTTRAGTLEDRR
jgi:hypothetical protein